MLVRLLTFLPFFKILKDSQKCLKIVRSVRIYATEIFVTKIVVLPLDKGRKSNVQNTFRRGL